MPGSMVAGICNIKNNSEHVQSKHASRKGSLEIARLRKNESACDKKRSQVTYTCEVATSNSLKGDELTRNILFDI